MYKMGKQSGSGALVLTLLLAGAGTSWASGLTTGYSGEAFGTSVRVTAGAAGITSGTTASAVLCTFTAGVTNSNEVAGVNLGSVVSTGAIQDSLSSESAGSAQSTVGTVSVASVNLLGGLVSADTLVAVSQAISSQTGYSTSAAGTTFGNLRVLGIPIGLNVSPNTEIKLPGIGYVVLNEQTPTVTANSAQLTVTLVHIHIDHSNSLGLPVGSTIEIGSATAQTIATVSLLSGSAYASFASIPPITVGATAPVTLPCGGTTNGQVITNQTAGITIPAILTVGATTDTAEGTVGVSSASGVTTASVAGLNVLNGLIQASAIKAVANVSANSSGVSVSDEGSTFLRLTVTGHPEIGANPAPNTQVSLAGLGTLYLHRVIQGPAGIEVRMVELEVTLANDLGLPVGADIRIAEAKVGAVTP